MRIIYPHQPLRRPSGQRTTDVPEPQSTVRQRRVHINLHMSICQEQHTMTQIEHRFLASSHVNLTYLPFLQFRYFLSSFFVLRRSTNSSALIHAFSFALTARSWPREKAMNHCGSQDGICKVQTLSVHQRKNPSPRHNERRAFPLSRLRRRWPERSSRTCSGVAAVPVYNGNGFDSVQSTFREHALACDTSLKPTQAQQISGRHDKTAV